MILSYREIWRGRTAVASTTGRQYERVWLFICDWQSDVSLRDTPVTIKQQFGSVPDLPTLYYSAHPADPGSYCDRIDVLQYEDQPHLFIATAHYKTPDSVGGTLNDEAEPDPLLRKPEVIWGDMTIPEAVEKDIDGVPIVNAVGDLFDPPVVEERVLPVVYITRNEASFTLARQKAYTNTINAAPYSGYVERQAWMRRITAQTVYEHDHVYARVTYEIAFNDKTWDKEIPNVGFVGMVYAGPNQDPPFVKREILDPAGQRFSTPRALSAPGGSTPGLYLPNGPVNYLKFKTKRLADWATLSLPPC